MRITTSVIDINGKRYALPDTHVGVTVNDIDMSRQWTGDEVGGLPEVWRRFATERDELVTMRLAVITGPGGIEAYYLLHFRGSHKTPLTRISFTSKTGDADDAV